MYNSPRTQNLISLSEKEKLYMRELLGNVFGYEKKSDANAKIVIGALSGFLLGAAAGLLFAPQSGKETRDDIARAAEKGYEKAVETSKNVAGFVKDKSQEVSEKFLQKRDKVVEDAAEAVAEVADKVSDKAEDVAKDAKAKQS
jgi:gas vesicle protein